MENNFKDMKNLLENFKPINIPKFDLKIPDFKFNIPQIQEPALNKELFDSMRKSNQEKYRREIENNESLKALVDYNEKISNYNKELVSLNEKILNKINSLDDTLLFLNSAFIDKSKIDKEQGQAHNALLLELITIIDSKDEGKLKQFMGSIAAPVSAGLIVEYFKMKLGFSK